MSSLEKAASQSDLFELVRLKLSPYRRNDEDIHLGTEIMAELEIDSVEVLDTIMEIEDELDILVPLDTLPRVRTVGDLIREIASILAGGYMGAWRWQASSI